MILSNEPGYYREGAFGIRIENLIVVQKALDIQGADGRDQLSFETLCYVPIDRRLVVAEMMSADEIKWLNDYHAECYARSADHLQDDLRSWLEAATAPI